MDFNAKLRINIMKYFHFQQLYAISALGQKAGVALALGPEYCPGGNSRFPSEQTSFPST